MRKKDRAKKKRTLQLGIGMDPWKVDTFKRQFKKHGIEECDTTATKLTATPPSYYVAPTSPSKDLVFLVCFIDPNRAGWFQQVVEQTNHIASGIAYGSMGSPRPANPEVN